MVTSLSSLIVPFLLVTFGHGFVVDPDENRDVPQIIESRDFICQSHFVTTDDGYVLTLHRIVNPKFRGENLKPVLLSHGLLSSSVDFVINSPGGYVDEDDTVPSNNLGFELAKNGYDVWLGNSRGNTYALNHTSLSPKDKKFWEFTFDEMIMYDLPNTIDYVRNATKQRYIAYIGHSQGTLIMFGLLSSQPKYNDIIRPFVALAPVTTCGNIRSPIKYVARSKMLVSRLKSRGGAFLPENKVIKYMSDKFCPTKYGEICADVMFLLCGFDGKQLNTTRSPVYIAHSPAGTSSWNIVHFAQSVLSRRFQMFDFGKKKNRDRYGTDDPPEYLLENITNQYIALFTAQNDWLADPEDVQFLRDRLQEPLIDDYVVPFKRWNHLDFIWGMQAGQFVNRPIIDLLRKYA